MFEQHQYVKKSKIKEKLTYHMLFCWILNPIGCMIF